MSDFRIPSIDRVFDSSDVESEGNQMRSVTALE